LVIRRATCFAVGRQTRNGEEIAPSPAASPLRLIAMPAGSTVLAMGTLGEERVMAFFVFVLAMAPAEFGA
jgi:hypothetical protein